MRRSLFAILLVLFCQNIKAQFKQPDIMTVQPDSTGKELFSDFLGVTLWGADYAITGRNQDLDFKYTSVNTGYVMQHTIDTRNLNNTPNLGVGLEENLGEHLVIHFVDVSFGYSKLMWNWNIGAGLGYFVALDKKNNIRVRGCVDLFYEGISYGLGTYVDTSAAQSGFVVNGSNVGPYLNHIKYVDNSFCSTISLSFMFRTKQVDFIAGAGWNYVIGSSENINFYSTRVTLNNAVYDPSGNPVSNNVLKLGSYTLQIGIVREFGL